MSSTRIKEGAYLALWALDWICRPRMSLVGDTFESWASRNGYLHHIQRLENLRLAERRTTPKTTRPLHITPEGRRVLVGERDPETHWKRHWDGRWRLLTFDLPAYDHNRRKALYRLLRAHHFGCFQKSVWVTPDPPHATLAQLRGTEPNPHQVIVLEARTLDVKHRETLVYNSWPFDRIQEAYQQHNSVLTMLSNLPSGTRASNPKLRSLLATERTAWLKAIHLDPLLPAKLLPRDYPAQHAWSERCRILARLAGAADPGPGATQCPEELPPLPPQPNFA